MNDFVKERNEALLSLDKEKIDTYLKKCNPKCIIPKDDKVYWAGIHKAICNLFLVPDNNISLEKFDKSYNWLIENGFCPEIRFMEE